MSSKTLPCVVACLLVGGLQFTAKAVDLTWTGALDSNWGTLTAGQTNWKGDSLPSDGVRLLFNDASQPHLSNDIVGLTLNGFQFSSTATTSFTLTGNSVALANNAAITDLAKSDQTLALDGVALTGTQTISVGSGKHLTITSPLSGSGSLSLISGGTVTLAGANTYAGNVSIQSNTQVVLADGASLGAPLTSPTTATIIVGNLSTNASDTSTLTLGPGTTTLTAKTLAIDYHASTKNTVSASTLAVNGNATINVDALQIDAGAGSTTTAGGGNGALTLGAGATLTLQGAAGPATAVTTLDIANYNYGSILSTNIASITGLADFSAGAVNGSVGTINLAVGKSGAGSGTTATASLLFSNGNLAANTINIAHANTQGATGTLTLVSGATGTLSVGAGGITFFAKGTGAVNINGGTLALAGNITSAAAASASLSLNGGTLDMGGFSIGDTNNPIAVTLSQGTLANLGGTGINGAGLTLNSTGTLALAGTNTYTGPTEILAGALLLKGTLTSSPLLIDTNAILSGGGTLGSTLSFNPGSTLLFNPSTGGFTFSTTAGNLIGTGNVDLALAGDIRYDTPYTLFHNTVTPNFAFSHITGYDAEHYHPLWTYADNSYTLSFLSNQPAEVPEPASLALLGLGGTLLMKRRRRIA